MSNPKYPVFDLDHPDCDPPDCPAWAKEDLPAEMLQFRGRNGMPEPYRSRKVASAMNVRGIDRYHANQHLSYRPETAGFLYGAYSPTVVRYEKGLLPSYEALAAECTAGCRTDIEKAVALLERGATRVKHPEMPPCGHMVPTDRNADDESLLAGGAGWCNEQARVFIRLCQVSGIPARIVQLSYSDEKTGHCVVEFFAGGAWRMADASWFVVFPDGDGNLMSAAQCHTPQGREWFGKTMHRRISDLLALSDAEINPYVPEFVRKFRAAHTPMTERDWAKKLNWFGIINYPLPA